MRKSVHIIIIISLSILLTTLLASCSSPKQVTEELPKPQYAITIDIKSNHNLLLAKYDICILIDSAEIGVLKNGERFQKTLQLTEGEHALKVLKEADNTVYGEMKFVADSDATVKCRIESNISDIVFEEFSIGTFVKMVELAGMKKQEAVEALTQLGVKESEISFEGIDIEEIDENTEWQVVEQSISAGEDIRLGDTIFLICDSINITEADSTPPNTASDELISDDAQQNDNVASFVHFDSAYRYYSKSTQIYLLFYEKEHCVRYISDGYTHDRQTGRYEEDGDGYIYLYFPYANDKEHSITISYCRFSDDRKKLYNETSTDAYPSKLSLVDVLEVEKEFYGDEDPDVQKSVDFINEESFLKQYTEFMNEQRAIKEWSLVRFGQYEQDNNNENGLEAIEWIVYACGDDFYTLISKYALDCKPYNDSDKEVTWETCSLRKWLNNDFLSTAFSEDQVDEILVTDVDNSNKYGYADISGGKNTKDKVFLLNYSAATSMKKYHDTSATEYAIAQGAYLVMDRNACWWTRSPGGNYTTAMSQTIGSYHSTTWGGGSIRPVIRVKKTALVK